MTSHAKIALNPLPWVLTERGFDLSVPVLRQAFSEITSTPFKAIQADPPADLSPSEYRALLADYGFVPAPGYFAASFGDTPLDKIAESAKAGITIARPMPANPRRRCCSREPRPIRVVCTR